MPDESPRLERFEPDGDEHWVEANRERIERLADGDTADAWVFERLAQFEPLSTGALSPDRGVGPAGGPDSDSPAASYCPQCGEGVEAAARFCRSCGTALEA